MGVRGLFEARCGVILPVLCGVAAVAAATPAHALTVADSLCDSATIAAPKSYPAPDTLVEATQRLRTSLRQPLQPAQVQSALNPALGEAGTQPGQQILAEYCVTAGEVMRTGVEGSQMQAQNYLLSAYRYATASADRATVVTATYRLGLVWLGDPASAGSRGTGRKRSRSAQQEGGQMEPATMLGSNCEMMSGPESQRLSNRAISTAALECAASTGALIGDYGVSALARYRLAALALGRTKSDDPNADLYLDIARKQARLALSTVLKMPAGAQRAEIAGRILWILIDAGELSAPGIAQAIPAMIEGQEGDPGIMAFAEASKARLALARKDMPAARAAANRAIFHESQRPVGLRLYEWYLLLGDADPEHGTEHALAAYRALESVRPLLPKLDPVTQEPIFATRMRPIFESAVQAELLGGNALNEAQRIGRAQEIVEASRQAELQSVFGNECIPSREPVKLSALRPNEILLYPVLLPDRVELLYASGADASAPGGIAYKRIAAPGKENRDSVARLVRDMIVSINIGDNRWEAASRTLYDLLITPVEGKLDKDSTLVIVPDGALRSLPFGALRDASGQYLVQRTRLSIIPSLAYSQPGRDRGTAVPAVVAAALQRAVDLPSGYFEKLEGTEEEARTAIAQGGEAKRNRLIVNFRSTDLASALAANHVDILHLATHASFNGRSDRAFIVADGETIPLSALRGLIGRNLTRGEELDLLILSACETAVGDDEAAMGLAGAAVQAGASSAIASLWEINDTGTVSLMQKFYNGYRAGQSKSEALREAQLAMIQAGGDNADPYIWAAFVLLGAWR